MHERRGRVNDKWVVVMKERDNVKQDCWASWDYVNQYKWSTQINHVRGAECQKLPVKPWPFVIAAHLRLPRRPRCPPNSNPLSQSYFGVYNLHQCPLGTDVVLIRSHLEYSQLYFSGGTWIADCSHRAICRKITREEEWRRRLRLSVHGRRLTLSPNILLKAIAPPWMTQVLEYFVSNSHCWPSNNG